jgi:hypothetical protein
MEGKVTVSARADGIGAQRFAEMVDSAPFVRLRERVEKMLERERGTCERGVDGVELRRAQGAVEALRTVLVLPKVILSEMRAKTAKGE